MKLENQPAVRFYDFAQLPEAGNAFDEVQCRPEDTYVEPSDPAVSGEAVPENVKIANQTFRKMFVCSDHVVQVEKIDNDFYLILRWRGGKALRRPIIISKFDEKKLFLLEGNFLAVDIGKKEITIADKSNSKYQIANLTDSTSPFFGNNRFIVIPVNLHDGYINAPSLVGIDLERTLLALSDGAPLKMYTSNHIRSGSGNPTGLYVLDLWTFDSDEEKMRRHEEYAINSERRPIDTNLPPAPKPRPLEEEVEGPGDRDAEDFIKMIREAMKRPTESFEGKDVELMFDIDVSGSMEPATVLTLRSVSKLIKELKEGGARSVSIGLMNFGDDGDIELVIPLREMNKKNLVKFFDKLGSTRFRGGTEPVGESVKSAFSYFSKKENTFREVVVLTDDDGLNDDKAKVPYLPDAIRDGRFKGISVYLKLIDSLPAYEVALKPMADIQKDKAVGNTKSLLDKALKNEDPAIRAEAGKAIIEMGKEAKDALKIFAQKTKNDVMRKRAQIALASMMEDFGGDKIAEIALAIASDPLASREMLRKLINIGLPARSAILIIALKSTNDWMRLEAARGLVALGTRARNELVQLAIESNDDRVRFEVAKALIKMGEDVGFGNIVDLVMDSESEQLRYDAVKYLGSSGAQGTESLIRLKSETTDIWLQHEIRAILNNP